MIVNIYLAPKTAKESVVAHSAPKEILLEFPHIRPRSLVM